MKRVTIFALVCLMVLAYCTSTLATPEPIQPYAHGTVSGGLTPQSNGKYLLWGQITGSPSDTLTIHAVLRDSSGGYITDVYNSGRGPSVIASKTVTLASGTYYIHINGTTPTHTPSTVIKVNI